jgi:2-beta-glucuronyltransferase
MLFDRSFFEFAAPAFPDITFHVIGAGIADKSGFPPNVRVYDEMPYEETLRYIKHARVGIAPYLAEAVPPYLTETSMKLMQYRFFGVPAVCPASVTGGADDRFGYEPGSASSIDDAIRRALASPRVASDQVLSWSEVTDRLIDPHSYADTHLADQAYPLERAVA